jgi:predicted nicotinamide N-methyase
MPFVREAGSVLVPRRITISCAVKANKSPTLKFKKCHNKFESKDREARTAASIRPHQRRKRMTQKPHRGTYPISYHDDKLATNAETTMRHLSIFYFILSLTQVESWIEHKMIPPSVWATTQRQPRHAWHPPLVQQTPPRSDRQYTPLVMTTEAKDVDTFEPVLAPKKRERRQISLGNRKKATVLSRTVPIAPDWNVTVWEWEKPAAVVETFWQVEQQGLSLTPSQSQAQTPLLDPFGLVCWPGAVVAAQEMKEYRDLFAGKRVLILGAGCGVEAQAAAQLGAKHVVATDIHPTTLKLCKYGAEQAGLSSVISTQVLDLRSVEPLPSCDIIVAADVLYNEQLALLVIKRILESQKQNDPPPYVLVTDSQRFVTDFDTILSQKLQEIGRSPVQWISRWLPTFTGSGVVIDADQTYDVKARVLWVNKKW